MVARLVIGTQDNTGVFANIPVPITYQISDIREPEKRKGSRSLTIKIPATQDTNILFENIFQVNIDLQTFDPRLKTSATYYIDELSQLVGYIQLLKILKDETTGKVEYELNLLGELKTFFTEVNGEYLDELDFSAYMRDKHEVDAYISQINSELETVHKKYPNLVFTDALRLCDTYVQYKKKIFFYIFFYLKYMTKYSMTFMI
jgi:hypothetical protein